jgi:hypothetical protein
MRASRRVPWRRALIITRRTANPARTLRSTNAIESMISISRNHARHVKP